MTAQPIVRRKTHNQKGQWLPPLPDGSGSVKYGLGGHRITADVWDFETTENVEIQSLDYKELSPHLAQLMSSLPNKDTGLQLFPVRFGDECIAPLIDGVVLFGVKHSVEDGDSGVEHVAVKLLLDPSFAHSSYAKALQNRSVFNCLGADGLMLIAAYWEEYSFDTYQCLVNWDMLIPEAYKDFFTTEGWIHCAITVTP